MNIHAEPDTGTGQLAMGDRVRAPHPQKGLVYAIVQADPGTYTQGKVWVRQEAPSGHPIRVIGRGWEASIAEVKKA